MNYRTFLSVFILFPLLLHAQNDTITTVLSEVVVSATKTQTPYYALGSSVTVVSADEISQKQLNTVTDVLREVPGLSVFQLGGPGMLTYVNLRGANTNHTLVIVDGAEMNDPSSPSNAFDFSTLNTADIEKVEVVRGPQSTLYGSEAIAGVINIFTKKGNSKPSYSLLGEGGSNGYYRGNVSAGGQYNFINYYFNTSQSGSNGISASDSKFGNKENDGFKNNFFSSRVDLNIAKELKLNLIYKFTKFFSDLDQNEKFGDDPNFTYKTEEQIFKGGISLSLLDGKLEQMLNSSLVKRFSNTNDNVDELHPFTSSYNYTNAKRIKLDWQNNLSFLKNNLITFGIESETEKANTSYYSNSEWGPYESVFPEQSNSTTGMYIQNQLNLSNTFFASAGLRYDKNNKFGGVTTFRFAPAYYISRTGTKFKASYGTGFKAPSLFYLFDPLFGNPDLKPEKSTGWDFGFEQFLDQGKISFGITYFNLQLQNMFGYDANYRTINIAEASSNGIEFALTAPIYKSLNVNMNYTFNETKDNYAGSDDFDKPLLRRPKHQFFIGAEYEIDNLLNLSAQIKYSGKRDDKDFSTYPVQRVTLADYMLVNFSASYKIIDHLRLTGRIQNLFDKKYEEVLYYGTLGRSFYAGINVDL